MLPLKSSPPRATIHSKNSNEQQNNTKHMSNQTNIITNATHTTAPGSTHPAPPKQSEGGSSLSAPGGQSGSDGEGWSEVAPTLRSNAPHSNAQPPEFTNSLNHQLTTAA